MSYLPKLFNISLTDFFTMQDLKKRNELIDAAKQSFRSTRRTIGPFAGEFMRWMNVEIDEMIKKGSTSKELNGLIESLFKKESLEYWLEQSPEIAAAIIIQPYFYGLDIFREYGIYFNKFEIQQSKKDLLIRAMQKSSDAANLGLFESLRTQAIAFTPEERMSIIEKHAGNKEFRNAVSGNYTFKNDIDTILRKRQESAKEPRQLTEAMRTELKGILKKLYSNITENTGYIGPKLNYGPYDINNALEVLNFTESLEKNQKFNLNELKTALNGLKTNKCTRPEIFLIDEALQKVKDLIDEGKYLKTDAEVKKQKEDEPVLVERKKDEPENSKKVEPDTKTVEEGRNFHPAFDHQHHQPALDSDIFVTDQPGLAKPEGAKKKPNPTGRS
jgi:hypothetical protein